MQRFYSGSKEGLLEVIKKNSHRHLAHFEDSNGRTTLKINDAPTEAEAKALADAGFKKEKETWVGGDANRGIRALMFHGGVITASVGGANVAIKLNNDWLRPGTEEYAANERSKQYCEKCGAVMSHDKEEFEDDGMFCGRCGWS